MHGLSLHGHKGLSDYICSYVLSCPSNLALSCPRDLTLCDLNDHD